MASNQSISQSFFGPILQFIKEDFTQFVKADSTAKLWWKINDLAKKVSWVALSVFFAIGCLISDIDNPKSKLSLIYGGFALAILVVTNIASIVKSLFEDIEQQNKKRNREQQLKELEEARKAKENADRELEKQRLEALALLEEQRDAAERARREKEESDRKLEAEKLAVAEALKEAEAARALASEVEETARKQKEDVERRTRQEIADAEAETERRLAKEKAKRDEEYATLESSMATQTQNLQQKVDSAFSNNQDLEAQITELKSALKETGALNEQMRSRLFEVTKQNEAALENAQKQYQEEKEKLINAMEDEKIGIQNAHESVVASIGETRDQYLRELQNTQAELRKAGIKIEELGQAEAKIEGLNKDVSLGKKEIKVLTRALKGLFKDCLTGDANDKLFEVIRLAEAADKKGLADSTRCVHQKYIEIFSTALKKLTDQGSGLDLGTELTSVLKKAIERPDPSKPGVIDYLLHPIDSFRSASHSSSQPEPSQSSSSSSTLNPSQSDRSGSSGQVSTEASSSTTPSNPDSSMSLSIDGILEDGTKINFQRITGDDDCGFVTLGTTQKDVRETLIVLSRDEKTRGRLCGEVYEALTTNATAIISKYSDFQSLRTWKGRQDLLDQSLIKIRKKYKGLLTFSAELNGDAVYQNSIDWLKTNNKSKDWLRTNRKSEDDTLKLMNALHDREQAIKNLKLNCIKREVYYHLYCREYLNRLGCESAMIYAEQKKKFPLYIWEQLPDSPHLSLRKSYSDPSLDQSNAVHLLYSMGRNHFDRLVVLDQPALAVDEVDSPSPPSSSSSSTTGEGQKTPPEETTVRLAEFQAHATEQLSQNRVQYGVEPYSGGNSPPSPSSSSSITIEEETFVPFQAFAAQQSPKNRVQGGTELDFEVDRTLTDESAVLGSGSAGVTKDQPDDTQTKPAVEPAVDLPHSTGAETLNSPSDNESSDDDDPQVGDSISESTSFLSSSSNSNDGESHKTKPKKKGFFGSLFG